MGKTTISALRVFSDTDGVDEVNVILGLEALKWQPKESKVARLNERLSGKLRSVWFWESPAASFLSPDEHVAQIATLLEDRSAALAEMLAKSWQVDIVMTYGSDNGQGGLTLKPELLRRLAALGVGFSMNVSLTGDGSDEQ